MGLDWGESSVQGFFELIDGVAKLAGSYSFSHHENINEQYDDELFGIWTRWRESGDA